MPPLLWLLTICIGLWIGVTLDRQFRIKRQEAELSRRRWREYAEMTARNEERWRVR